MASAWFDYTLPGNGARGDLTLGVGGRLVGSSYADNANTDPVPSRVLFDAAVKYQIRDNVALSANVTNLLDKEYISQIDGFSNTAYYGDRRTVLATLKYTW